ncbi:MAG: 6-bladed beta-propeller [bacterium]|nr:6-bladed beta-propeller [bacterium]
MRRTTLSILILLTLAHTILAETSFRFDEYKSEDFFKRGFFYYSETKYTPAVEFFIKSLQYNPNFFPAKIWLGKAYRKAGYLSSTMETWQEVVDNGGADNTLIDKLNNMYFRVGRPDKRNLIKPYSHFRTIDGRKWDGKSFSQPVAVYADENNGVFITGLASRAILRLDPNDKVIKKYTSGRKSFKMPYGFALDARAHIIVSDVKRDRIEKISKTGELLFTSGGTGTGDGRFLGPEGICVDIYNNILVADTGNCRVQKFSPEGVFMMKFGSKGDEAGQFLKPTSVTVDEKNNIYVGDAVNMNIQKFDEDGNFLEYVFGDKKFSTLRNIHCDKEFFLIADGVQGGYIYNRDDDSWLNIKNFNFNRDKLLNVSDLFMTRDRTLYVCDFYKNTVEVFVPEAFKYANLETDIELIDTIKYPRVVVYASVYKKDGTPVPNLTRENFQVRELNVRMTPLDLLTSLQDKEKIKVIYLVEKSFKMQNYLPELKEAGSYLVKNILKTKDEVRVENFHQSRWTGLKYDFSQLRILSSMEEDNYNTINDVSRPLYESITELMNKLSRKALVFFTTGEFDIEKNFKNYELEVCRNYAIANHVPVFIVNFTQNNEQELKELARSTGGQYYYYFKDAGRLQYIRNEIIKIPINQYVIIYETVKNDKLGGAWREIELEVDFNKLKGKDKSGYFIPE